MAGRTEARPFSDKSVDDLVQPFRTLRSRAQGRLVRLGPVADTILQSHDYPPSVCEVFGEAVGLTALLGAVLQPNGKLTLQTSTDGPVGMMVVKFQTPGQMRGYASYKPGASNKTPGQESEITKSDLIGTGHLALTLEHGGDSRRYQGIVALDDGSLPTAAHNYFSQSEQLPTFIRLAVARHYGPQIETGSGGAQRAWHWRVGGLILQQLPLDVAGLPERPADVDDESRPEDNEDWQRVRMLAATVEDHELLDPTLSPERLLYNLFAEEEVSATAPVPISFHCGCTREGVDTLLRSFGANELDDLREPDGSWTVKCEFCNKSYRFTPHDLAD